MPPTIKVKCAPVVTGPSPTSSTPMVAYNLVRATVQATPFHNPSFEGWEDHPALKTAFDCLNIYNQWVAQRVIPIAFQWIEEHHHEVHEHVAPDKHNDVGAVIAAAFELVRNGDKYRDWAVKSGQIGDVDLRTHCNPMWAGVAAELQEDMANVFANYEAELAQMVAQTWPEPVAAA